MTQPNKSVAMDTHAPVHAAASGVGCAGVRDGRIAAGRRRKAQCGAAADSSARRPWMRCRCCVGACLSRSVSRDLLQLEGAGAPISPFLISPGGGGGAAFPFAPPPSRQLGHAPLPLPAALAGSSDAAAAAASAAGGNGAAASASAFGSGPPSRLKTFSIPPSSLLSRVQAFLPELAKANAKLEQVGHGTRAGDERIGNWRRLRVCAGPHTGG